MTMDESIVCPERQRKRIVKCPRGTKEQITANYEFMKNLTASSCQSCDHDTDESFGAEEEHYLPSIELDDVRADKRNPPTTEDEIVFLFYNFIINILLKCWKGKPCPKPKLGEPTDGPAIPLLAEDGSESMCESFIENTSSFNLTGDHLNDLYRSRSQKLSDGVREPESRISSTCRKLCESRKSEVTDAEYPGIEESETITETEAELPWKVVVPDEDVYLSLQNGAWYEGRVSRRMMDGDGKFFWEDGGHFQGEFIDGAPKGSGTLYFPNEDLYEGTVFRGYRHGEGLYCSRNSPVMYSGEWWLGLKSGKGLIIYNDPSKSINFYKGSWLHGVKEGFGYRQYPSGSKYIGYWQNGKKHGTGIMFWCNHDIYRGQWKNDLMDGFGEYTWNGFVNKSFSYPRINRYRGFWKNGKRNGCGILEMSNGCFLETVWVDDKKNGPGVVLCSNGLMTSSDNLFKNDKPALLNKDGEDQTGLILRNRGQELKTQNPKRRSTKFELPKASNIHIESQFMAYVTSLERAKAISIPVHTPVHAIDLTLHLKRLQERKEEFEKRNKDMLSTNSTKSTAEISGISDATKKPTTSINISAEFNCEEEKLLRYSIMRHIKTLKTCYDTWSIAACHNKPDHECILLRIFFWELLTQCNVPRRNLSLVDINKILMENEFMMDTPHDPFERIQFWQFIHFLITISWHLYGQYVYADFLPCDPKISEFLERFCNQTEEAVLATAFDYFLFNHIINGQGKSSEIFKKNDLVPMDAMYMAYKSIGEPHSARDFLRIVCGPNNDDERLPIDFTRFFEKLPNYKTEGKNAITFADEICYLPTEQPFNQPEITPMQRETKELYEKSKLSCFAPLGPKGVIKCLIQVCPSIVEDGLIVDMEYQLVFLEFYKAVISCAELALKKQALAEMRSEILVNYKNKMIEYEKQMREFTKQRDSSSALSKKTSLSKKIRK